MKKALLIFLSPIFIVGAILFLRPLLILNPKNLAWVLKKTHVFKEWSWESARFSHERLGLFHRNFEGEFKKFCFVLDRDALNLRTCLDQVSWDFDVVGLTVKTIKPFTIISPRTDITPKAMAQSSEPDTPPDLKGHWNRIWGSLVPDLYFKFADIRIHRDKELKFNLELSKKLHTLEVKALGYRMLADPSKLTLLAPPRVPFPKDLGTTRPLYFKDFKLTAFMQEKEGIPLELTGFLETIKINFRSHLSLPLQGSFSSLSVRKGLVSEAEGEILLTGLKESLRDYAPEPFNELPAPLNIMDGDIVLKLSTASLDEKSELIKAILNVNLMSEKQVVRLDLKADIPLSLVDFKRGVPTISVNIHQLALRLPRLSKRSLPPQLKPDGRFKTHEEIIAPKAGKSGKANLRLIANEDPVSIKTELLDEDLRLRFDLDIKRGVLKDGFISVLPLKTTVFKRPIKLESLRVKFQAPLFPILESVIVFPLPEYKITMKVEGPLGKPRYAFQSEPPLPENDIYAVLLFGRPMNDLDSDDKSSASKTNRILSQGFFSLSTLYFLAGSPVEYVGYDPDSQTATAQIGLGRKSSLRVGGGQEGLNSTAVRRSLGKGWYLDTSVQDTSRTPTSTQRSQNNYGVMLERIIAY